MRSTFLMLMLLAAVACGSGVDQQRFDPVYRAGKALHVAVEQTGGVGDSVEALLTTFHTEIATLDGRTRGDQEAAALAKYREAADAYQFLLRLRFLDFEAVNGRVLLAGTNLVAANRYGLTVEDVQPDSSLGGHGWSNSAAALKTLFELAPRTIAEADGLVNGQ